MSWSSRVMTFRFDSKTRWQMFCYFKTTVSMAKPTDWGMFLFFFFLFLAAVPIWMGTNMASPYKLSSVNLSETLFQITHQWITAQTGCLYINHLSYPSFFIYIFIFIYISFIGSYYFVIILMHAVSDIAK